MILQTSESLLKVYICLNLYVTLVVQIECIQAQIHTIMILANILLKGAHLQLPLEPHSVWLVKVFPSDTWQQVIDTLTKIGR